VEAHFSDTSRIPKAKPPRILSSRMLDNYLDYFPGSSVGRAVGCNHLSCSFPPRGGMKNRVNSGKPKEEIPFSSMVILSEACQRGIVVGRNVQRLEVEDPNQ
jgi:hypothetical protein